MQVLQEAFRNERRRPKERNRENKAYQCEMKERLSSFRRCSAGLKLLAKNGNFMVPQAHILPYNMKGNRERWAGKESRLAAILLRAAWPIAIEAADNIIKYHYRREAGETALSRAAVRKEISRQYCGMEVAAWGSALPDKRILSLLIF